MPAMLTHLRNGGIVLDMDDIGYFLHMENEERRAQEAREGDATESVAAFSPNLVDTGAPSRPTVVSTQTRQITQETPVGPAVSASPAASASPTATTATAAATASASAQMLQYVAQAKREAKQAESDFDLAAGLIEIKTGSSISLNSGTAVSQVAEIVSMSKDACDTLYASYQGLVRFLDARCRPLAEQGADADAVKELLELIKWLNEESKIKNNFAAELNGYGLGDIVNVAYSPTMESRMIERWWESAFAALPGAAEATRAYNQRLADERAAAREAERQRRELERQWEREERERVRKEQEEAEARRREEEAALKDTVETLRPLYRAADGLVSAGSYAWSNAVAVVLENGRVFATGSNDKGQCNVSGWTNIVQVVTKGTFTAGLTADGRVLIAGDTSSHRLSLVKGWSGVVKIAAGDQFIVGLRRDGRVLATGDYPRGHTNSTAQGPMYWTDIEDIFAENNVVIGRRRDGSLVAVRYNYYGRSEGFGLPQTMNGSADFSFSLGIDDSLMALTTDGKAAVQGQKMPEPEQLNRRGGIVKVDVLFGRPAALYADGTIVVQELRENDSGAKSLNRFIMRYNLNGRILAVGASGGFAAILTTDGEVYVAFSEYQREKGLSEGKLDVGGTVLTDWQARLEQLVSVRAGEAAPLGSDVASQDAGVRVPSKSKMAAFFDLFKTK